jgi:hypothetical protein
MKRATLALALLALVFAGCGGGSGTSISSPTSPTTSATTQSGSKPKGAYIAKADRVCDQMIQDALKMGVKFSETGPESDPLTYTTEELVRPAVGILEGSARQLRALVPEAEDGNFQAYVALYDPILAIARERVAAGLAGDAAHARELELLLVELSELQRPLAKSAGLTACDVDFFETFSSGGAQR